MLKRLNLKNILKGVVIIIAVYVGQLIPGYLMVVKSPSLSHRLYFYDRNYEMSQIRKGSYVSFDLKTDMMIAPELVTKKVVCDEGDYLRNEGLKFYCGNEYLGTAKTHTMDGRELVTFNYTGKVPHGYVFCMGEHYDSYDGRYYGFTKKSNIKAVAYPLL